MAAYVTSRNRPRLSIQSYCRFFARGLLTFVFGCHSKGKGDAQVVNFEVLLKVSGLIIGTWESLIGDEVGNC